MRQVFKFGFLMLCLLIFSCKKDKAINEIVPTVEACDDIPPEPIGLGYTYYYDSINFKGAVFNPLDGNEIFFVKNNTTLFADEIYKMNLASGQSTLVHQLNSGRISGQLSINNWGWILFNDALNSKVYAIKSNGDSLTFLMSSVGYVTPVWTNDFGKFLISYNSTPEHSLVINVGAGTQDTIFKELAGAQFSADGKVCHIEGPNPNIEVSDFDTLSWTYVTSNQSQTTKELILATAWHPNNQEIYFLKHSNGIWKVNYLSSNVSHVKPGCQTKNFVSLSISPDGAKIITERMNASLLTANEVLFSSRISLVDLGTGQETEINP